MKNEKIEKLEEGIFVNGQIDFMNNGSAYLMIEGVQTPLFIHKKNTLNALHLDTCKVEVFKKDGKIEGKVDEVISRFKTEWVGTVQRNKDLVFVIPDSNKMPVDFYVPNDASMGAKDKEKVIVKLIKWKKGTKSPYAKIIKILGSVGDNNTEMNAIMHEYGLPVEFPKDVELEAELISFEIPEREIKKRRDMRGIATFTIDPVDAKDFDDALSVNVTNDYIEVGVHIADVTHYIVPGSKLDEEAFNRSTSVYLVDRCVPMLPERLSNGVCSLRPHEDKLCYSVVFKLDNDGNILDKWFGRTIIHSDRRFTYEEAQEIIEGKDGDYMMEVRLLDKIAKKIRARRITHGSLEMDQPEVRFKLDENGKPIDVYFKIQKDSNKLIEEYMLLANQAVANLIKSKGVFSVNRIHEEPDMDKLEKIKSFSANFGHELNLGGKDVKAALNKLLLDIKGMPEENMISTLVVRSQQKAKYSTKNVGHYGLGFKDYSHFTSPIRRLADVYSHRLLTHVLNNEKPNTSRLEEACEHMSKQELLAAKAQRDSIKYKQAEYLEDKIGKVFKGVVSGITDWGVYVEIIENKCEGMIRFKDLGDDTYTPDTNNYRVVGFNTGHVIRLGDEVMVVVKGVNLEKKSIDLSIL